MRWAAGLLLAALAWPCLAEPPLRLKLSEQTADAPAATAASRPVEPPEPAWRCPAPLPVAGALNLRAVLQALVCQNAALRQAEGLADQARATLQRAQAQAQPTLGLATGWDAVRGSGSDLSLLVRLDWVILDFGSRDAALRQARHALAGALAEQGADLLDALSTAAQLYTAAQSARGRLEAADHSLHLAQSSERVVVARHAAGAATLVDKLQAQTALAQAVLEQARAQAQWLTARGELALAAGLRAHEPLDLPPDDADDELQQAPVDLQGLMDEARELHPRVQAARERLSEARERGAAAVAQRWGELALGARAGRNRASSDSEVRGRASAALEWSVPLWDGGLWQARVLDARGVIQQRQVALDEARRLAELRVWQQGQLLIAEQQALRQCQALQDSAEQALRAASERYRQGVGAFADVLSAQAQAAAARRQLAEARAGQRQARWRLAAAIGRLGPL